MIKSRFLAAFALFALLQTVSSTQAQAQTAESFYEETPRLFSAGLIIGGNATQVDGDRYAGYRKFGLNAGGVVYVHFNDHLAASLEILFSQKGARAHYANQRVVYNNATYELRKYGLSLNYAEIPLQISYFDKRKSHLSAGLSAARLISVNESGTTLPATAISFENFPVRKMDYNIVAGFSLHLVKGLFFQSRFQYSLRPIRDGKVPEVFARSNEQFNNMWTVRLMYLFE